jgi:hypothetical protein
LWYLHSSAYNALEGHAFSLEGQLREAQSKIKAMQGQVSVIQYQATAAAVPPTTAETRSNELPAMATDTGIAGGRGAQVAISEADVVRRVEEAAAVARHEAEVEGEEAMNDLLVCLGQVRRLMMT